MTRRRVAWTLAGVGVVLLLGTAWVGYRALHVRDDLNDSAALMSQLHARATTGDVTGLDGLVTDLQAATQSSRENSSDPVWEAATHLPWLGDDLDAVQQVSRIADDLADNTVEPLADVGRLLAVPEATMQQRVETLGAAQPTLEAAHDVAQRAAREVEAIDTADLVSPLANAIGDLRPEVAEAAHDLDTAARAAAAVPALLNPTEPKTYLLLFQNLAEVRSQGGIAGAFAIVRAEGGQLTIERQGSSGDMGPFEEPVTDPKPHA